MAYVPLVLKSRDKYVLTEDKSFTELCYRLRKQSTIIIPEIGGEPLPLPSEPVLFSPQKPPVESSLEQTPKETEYRKKVEGYVNKVPLSEPYNEISNISKKALETIRQRIGLDTDKAKAIENAVLQSRRQRHKIYKQNLQEYHKLLMESLEKEEGLSHDILSELKDLQDNWEISDKDATELLLYAQLEYLLQKENWIEADKTTTNLLLKVANVQQNYFSLTDFHEIPCEDIRKIDKLWSDYSNGHFGYRAQIDIWQKFQGKLFDFFVALDWAYYNEDRHFVYIDYFKHNRPNPPKGHRPASVVWEGGNHETRQAYINKIQQCYKDVVP